MVASAAAVAGSLVACGDTGGQESACAPGEGEPAALPAFESDRCTDQIGSSSPPPDESRFATWNEELRTQAAGRESAMVDLDAVDHNVELVGSQLGSRIVLRLVAKSLPSIRLLEYMMLAACANRVMAFSEGMIRDLLCRFGSDVDILLGRPATVEAAARTFATLDERHPGDSNPASSVRWLIDTAERLAEYRDFADERGTTINVAVEIDVGLRRGGAIDDEELLAMLSIIDESSRLRFTGFMGYEGHVPFAPTGANPDNEFAQVQQRYADFVQAGTDAFPALFEGPLVHNSGGSRTYHRYTDDLRTPVNEVAMGSAFFFPFNFADLPSRAEDDPNLEVSFHVVGGGFAGEQVFPDGLVENTAVSGGAQGVNNLLSNQAQWLGSREVPLEVGDFVFYHPWEGDGIRWLSRLDVFRNGELVDQWSTFQPGIQWT